MNKRNAVIKKLISVLSILVLVFMMNGCVSNEDFDIVLYQVQNGKYAEIYRAFFTDDLVYHDQVKNSHKDKIGINEVDIKDGVAKIVYANCPTQTCTQYIARNNHPFDTITCLPNGLKIILERHKG